MNGNIFLALEPQFWSMLTTYHTIIPSVTSLSSLPFRERHSPKSSSSIVAAVSSNPVDLLTGDCTLNVQIVVSPSQIGFDCLPVK